MHRPRGTAGRPGSALRLLAAVALCAGWLTGCGRMGPLDAEPDAALVSALREGGAAASGGDGDAAAATGEGWGTLRGRFVYQGDAPQRTLSVQISPGDAQACGQHPIPDETLVVDPATRGIKNIIVFARRVPRVHPSAAPGAAQPTEFDQRECRFLSRAMVVRTGQTIVVKNSDPIGHNTNISPSGDRGINPLLPGGGSAEYAFGRSKNVPVPVSCNIHPWMRAYILPRDDGYCAVTAADGTFEIADLPAGVEIEFVFWHERGAGADGALAAGPIGSDGRLKLTVPADDVLELNDGAAIEVPASAFAQ